VPVISDIFTQNTISNSAYNGFQASLEKRFSHGLQFEAAYTYGKSIDNASTFESLVDPINPKRNRSLSLFDARTFCPQLLLGTADSQVRRIQGQSVGWLGDVWNNDLPVGIPNRESQSKMILSYSRALTLRLQASPT